MAVYFLVGFALILEVYADFSITPTIDATTLLNAALGPGLTVVSASYQGWNGSAGTYTDGPLGTGHGAILTSGLALNALPSTDSVSYDASAAGYNLCTGRDGSGTSYDAAVLTATVNLHAGFTGISGKFVFASQEYTAGYDDGMGIFIDGVQVALDNVDGDSITAQSSYFLQYAVVPPDSGTSYSGSTPLLQFGKTVAPGHHDLIFVVCDIDDGIEDSALLFNVAGCTNCQDGTVIVSTSSSSSSTTSTSTTASSSATTLSITESLSSDISISPTTNADPSTTDVTTNANATGSADPSILNIPGQDFYAKYLGCEASSTAFSSFELAYDAMANNTLTMCASECARRGRFYAGAYDQSCYCGLALDASTATTLGSLCNKPCPGDKSQMCGGRNDTLVKRQTGPVPAGTFLSTYQIIPLNSTTANTTTTTTAVSGSAKVTSTGLITIVLSTTINYITVCPTNPGLLTPASYCSSTTITCPADKVPTKLPPCPMTTTEMPCRACGPEGQSQVTLTLPVDVISPTTSSGQVNVKGSGTVANGSQPTATGTAATVTTAGGNTLQLRNMDLRTMLLTSIAGVAGLFIFLY
ncbi:hypothetical protein BX600DRAFT_507326 [Xylariales sp. PMI_506]|nr:hypothetical protein BX600DRAFT_507326 [Xylariales sp. PMI_506]